MLVSIPYAEHLGNMASIYFRGSTAEAAAARQDLFRLALEPTFVGLSHFAMAVTCHPCAVAMLCLVHATTCQLLSFKIHSSWWNAS